MNKFLGFIIISLMLMIMSMQAATMANIATLRDAVAFDVDLARRTHVEELRFYYQAACRYGIENYPPEYKMDRGAYNPNNPGSWCRNVVDDKDEAFLYSAFKLGKREKK